MVATRRSAALSRRQDLGLPQAVVAARARITRQSLSAIEAGRAVPSVDVALRIARALGSDVERLFSPDDESETVDAEISGAMSSARVTLAKVSGRWVALPLGRDGLRVAADGILESDAKAGTAHVRLVGDLEAAADNVVLSGCSAALGLLADHLNGRRRSGRFLWQSASTRDALSAVVNGFTHVAGTHHSAAKDEDGNLRAVERLGAKESLALVTLAGWEVGYLSRCNDHRVCGTQDLANPQLRLVGRPPGSGARALLERELESEGLEPSTAARAAFTVSGHLEVAQAVENGAADVGVATRDAAIAFGLRFVPISVERYDLVVPQALLNDERVRDLLDVMTSRGVRAELESLGYDVSHTGQSAGAAEAT